MDSFEELREKARAGKPEAWDQLWAEYGSHLRRVARRRLPRRLQGKAWESDLVQETFLQAHQDFLHFRGTTENELKAWFAQILLHNITDFERRYRQAGKRKVATEESWANLEDIEAPTPSPAVEALEREKTEAFGRALESLGKRDRQILQLRMQEGLPFDKIGPLMGLSEAAARSLWYGAIQRLARKLEFFRDDR